MPLQYFGADTDTADVIRALQRDGATIVRNQVGPEVTDAILTELRKPFDEVGKCDESEFNGYKTYDESSHSRPQFRKNRR